MKQYRPTRRIQTIESCSRVFDTFRQPLRSLVAEVDKSQMRMLGSEQ